MKNNAIKIKYKIVLVFPAPKDCQDYLWEGYRKNGLYTIYPQKGGRLTSSVTSKLMEEVGR